MVDPGDQAWICAAVAEALKKGKNGVPEGLEYFSYENFAERLHGIAGQIMSSFFGIINMVIKL